MVLIDLLARRFPGSKPFSQLVMLPIFYGAMVLFVIGRDGFIGFYRYRSMPWRAKVAFHAPTWRRMLVWFLAAAVCGSAAAAMGLLFR
jgi:hypothetical protein